MKKLALISLIFLSSHAEQSLTSSCNPTVQVPQFYQQYGDPHSHHSHHSYKKPMSKLNIVGISVGSSVVVSTLVATVVSFVMCKVRL